jgi:hypothetical protein
VDVPPAVELMVIRRFLIDTGRTWEQADPTGGQLLPGAADVRDDVCSFRVAPSFNV